MGRSEGFTLAEVLVTLGIIGVVAATTLPALITRNQNKALEAGLKKNYSVILQAFEMYQAQHGERLTSTDTMQRNGDSIKKRIMPYFKVLHDCGEEDSSTCIPYSENAQDGNFTKYKTYTGKPLTKLKLFDDGQIILMDGSLIMFENAQNNSQLSFISVDINGYYKNPNKLGHDIFTFQLMEDGRILPMGDSETVYGTKDAWCSSNSTEEYNGIGCTYYALNDKDYFNNLPR